LQPLHGGCSSRVAFCDRPDAALSHPARCSLTTASLAPQGQNLTFPVPESPAAADGQIDSTGRKMALASMLVCWAGCVPSDERPEPAVLLLRADPIAANVAMIWLLTGMELASDLARPGGLPFDTGPLPP